jgi:Oxidoreductase FAD-binding domain
VCASRRGHFDLVVKVYPKGNISKYLGDMKEGDTIEAKGPIQKLPYKANMKKKIGMIAGARLRCAQGCLCCNMYTVAMSGQHLDSTHALHRCACARAG